jgi:uncharacterized protein YciI
MSTVVIVGTSVRRGGEGSRSCSYGNRPAPLRSTPWTPVLPAHVGRLDEQYADGVLLASGPEDPRDGGIIVAVAEDRARIEAIVAGDPSAEGQLLSPRARWSWLLFMSERPLTPFRLASS